MLTYEEIEKILPESKGIKDAGMSFASIAFTSDEEQPKGLFIQNGEDEDLQAAISNGAIAAVWPSEKELPFYTPNHFPVFLAKGGTLSAAVKILEENCHKVSLEKANHKTWVLFPKTKDHAEPNDLVEKMKQLIQSDENCVDRNGVR
ncbi:hypothetical protein D5F11_005715 [Siminovitchia terrae]|uniref:Uncharacterized protein n=1 Tax=Siminovitchia terrae TaxID=1914933 RepID=A0A429XC24_SIMTE|nr:hypothetical protein [Siminovitchia terrae]RST60841.1 hypothetical protein D5F11_005715 [Siminovitchia terrae]